MEILINIQLEQQLILPIAYNHILQSALFRLMADENDGTELHDKGFSYGNREYKLFTFGWLEGRYRIVNKSIIFQDNVQIRFRSIDEELCHTIGENAVNRGVTLLENVYMNVNVQYSNPSIISDKVLVKMRSPICVYETQSNNKYTHYFTPIDLAFYQYVEENFERKYVAAYGECEVGSIELLKVDVNSQDKYITRYKGTIIEAYGGIYQLRGNPQYIEFLYNVGLGSKNSQGFGMFDIIQSL